MVRRVEELSDEQVASLRSAETEMREGVAAALSDIRENLRTLNTAVARQDAELTMMDSVARGLERIVASMQGKVSPTEQASNVSKESSSDAFASKTDTDYLMLENRYRGSREEIARRLQIYPAMFSAASDSVLEIGPGRGELLQLFKEAGVSAYGVDINAAMSRCGREDGLIVETGDAVEHMRGLKDSSLSGVIAIQVIEHLSMSTLRELLSLCLSKVAPGGKVVFETINSESIVALTQHYFRDPTHVWPLHPETMRFAMEMAGFDVLEVRKLEPFPEAAQLASMPIEEYMTPRWVNLMHGINRNFELLNNILFGHQDYCIVALVPARQGSQ